MARICLEARSALQGRQRACRWQVRIRLKLTHASESPEASTRAAHLPHFEKCKIDTPSDHVHRCLQMPPQLRRRGDKTRLDHESR